MNVTPSVPWDTAIRAIFRCDGNASGATVAYRLASRMAVRESPSSTPLKRGEQ